MVVLVCNEHEDDAQFKREVLADPELVRCVKEREMLVWGADIRTREGYQGRWEEVIDSTSGPHRSPPLLDLGENDLEVPTLWHHWTAGV